MVKPEWGTKRQCLSCGVRFYDLGKQPIMCPKCEAPYEVEAVLKSRRPQAEAPAKVPAQAVPAVPKPGDAGDVAADGAGSDGTTDAGVADEDAAKVLLAADDDNGGDSVSKELDTKVETSDGG